MSVDRLVDVDKDRDGSGIFRHFDKNFSRRRLAVVDVDSTARHFVDFQGFLVLDSGDLKLKFWGKIWG